MSTKRTMSLAFLRDLRDLLKKHDVIVYGNRSSFFAHFRATADLLYFGRGADLVAVASVETLTKEIDALEATVK